MNRQAYREWLIVCTLALFALTTAAPAKTIRVNPDGSGDFPSIGAAVAAARSGDTIVLERGVYAGSNQGISFQGKILTVSSRDPNDAAVVADTVLDGQGRSPVVRSADGAEGGSATRLTLAGLTIRNGADGFAGGAVQWEQADLEAVNCLFEDSRSAAQGGAVYCRNNRAQFAGCLFTGNASDVMKGGALYATGSQVDFTDCSFETNVGSAVETYDCQVTVTRCQFERNKGREGGAICSRGDIDPASTSLTVARCTFVANTASGSGGAVYNYKARASLDACTFQTNTAGQEGGAVYNYRTSPTVSNCLFAGNTAAGTGGAVQNVYDSGADLVNCTFVANDAPKGAAVAGSGGSQVLLSHSILWNNTGTQGPSLYLGRYPWSNPTTATATIEYSDLEGDRDGTFVEPGCDIRWGSGNLAVDPLFVDPSRGDYRLSSTSPCSNAGDPTYTPETGQTDLDGRARLLGAAVDLGAFECPGLGPVYRFWSPVKSRHFYTMSAAERDMLLREYQNIWQYEGEAYHAFYQGVEENLAPVYRFWSPQLESHFWTISEEERANLIKNYPGVWVPEGIAFYAYPPGRQPLGTLPVYRFWSNRLGNHFYTISENEKDLLIRNYAQVWQFEGPAWYAYHKAGAPANAIYTFTGGPEQASFVLTLGAAVDGKDVPLATPDVVLSTASTWMQMALEFNRSSAMLDRLHIQTARTDYKAMLPSDGSDTAIPLTLSVEARLDVSTPQGPFAVDPSTGVFTDLTKPNPDIVVKDPLVRCSGTLYLGSQEKTFTIEGVANRFETEATGTFESLDRLPEELVANIPYTFQWHRQYVKDILADTSVAGHRVQVYVTSIYVGTQDRWQGKIAK